MSVTGRPESVNCRFQATRYIEVSVEAPKMSAFSGPNSTRLTLYTPHVKDNQPEQNRAFGRRSRAKITSSRNGGSVRPDSSCHQSQEDRGNVGTSFDGSGLRTMNL